MSFSRVVDLSCDLGEAITAEEQQSEEKLWSLVTSANVACGGHVGDESTMRLAIDRARRFGVQLGAHPSYPDRENFGRKTMTMDVASLRTSLSQQIEALAQLARDESVPLLHVKPHGALYNDAFTNAELARVFVDAVSAQGQELEVVCAPGSEIEKEARRRGLPVILEVFGDRRYQTDGSLTPRSRDGSLLLDFREATQQVVRLVEEGSVLAGENVVALAFGTLCLHGEMERAAERVAAVREALLERGVRLSREARRSLP